MPDDRATPDIAHGVPPIAVSNTTTLANRTGSWKYIQPIYQDRVAPCNAACPVGIDIEGVMNLLRQARVAEARELLLRENPMPAVTGRVCEHACQGACSRATFDEAVNIHAIERMLGDLDPARLATMSASSDPPTAPEAPHAHPDPPRTIRKERVAIVGSGPAGLACAYHLARLGYGVTIYEADPEPGGWLRYGVPEYKLPRVTLGRTIDQILTAGVTLRCGERVGRDVPWKELETFDAIFLATGAREREPFVFEGEAMPGVVSGYDYLRDVRTGELAEAGRRVAIVGGTELAVDCARTARRLGREPVVLFQGRREEMQADAETVEEALREGVRFEFMARVVGLQVTGHPESETALDAIGAMYDASEAAHPHPCLVGVACVRMQPLDSNGETVSRLVSVPRSSFVVPADVLVTAQGSEPEIEFLPRDVHRRGYLIRVDEFGRTNRDGLYAGGDVTGQPRTVAHSLGAGKRVAIGIDADLRRKAGETPPTLDPAALRYGATGNVSITRWRGDDPVRRTNELNEVVPFRMLNMAYFEHEPMRHDRHALTEPGGRFDESNLGLAPAEALAEAKRCFNCGVCNDCDVCMNLCPDVAIKRHSTGHGFSLSYKYCKGCGLCVEECPRGAMTMTREGL